MSHRLWTRSAVCLGALIALCVSGLGEAAAREWMPTRLTEQELQDQLEISRAQRDQIHTSRIKLKMLSYMGVKPEIPTAELQKRLDTLEETVNVGGFTALDRVVSELLAFAKSSPHASGTKWVDVEIIEDGGRIRNRWVQNGVLLRDSCYDGEREIQFQADSQQANVSAGRSNWSMITSRGLRHDLPIKEQWLEAANKDGRIEAHQQGGRLQVKWPQNEGLTVIDRATGLMTKSVYYSQGELSYLYQVMQLGEYPGGIMFPAVTAEIRCREGMVSGFDIYMVDEAQFNIAIDKGEFALPIPAETVIVRDKSLPGRPTGKTSTASPNGLNDPQIFTGLKVKSPPTFNAISLMVIAVGIAVLLVGAACWRAVRR